jgi:hypothetical protein
LKIYNRYVLYLAIAAGLVNILLAFGGQESLDVYFIVNSIVYLGITLLYVRFNPRARMALDIIGCMLFSGIMVIMVVKTIHNLSGR